MVQALLSETVEKLGTELQWGLGRTLEYGVDGYPR